MTSPPDHFIFPPETACNELPPILSTPVIINEPVQVDQKQFTRIVNDLKSSKSEDFDIYLDDDDYIITDLDYRRSPDQEFGLPHIQTFAPEYSLSPTWQQDNFSTASCSPKTSITEELSQLDLSNLQAQHQQRYNSVSSAGQLSPYSPCMSNSRCSVVSASNDSLCGESDISSVTQDGFSGVVDKKERKKLIERKRRAEMKGSFDQMKEIIQSVPGHTRKLSEKKALEEAAKIIEQLRIENERLMKQLDNSAA